MSTLNIGGDKSDASYRYKMPALQTKIEGRGNGIKTVILNMTEIARSLHIHPAYPTKYFGIELGAQSKFSALSDRAVVNGHHLPIDLAKILERFIAQFILCPVCRLPELKMSVKSSIKIDCAACGHNATMKTAHKLAQYIIKNPPKQLAEEEKEAEKKQKKVKTANEVAEAENEEKAEDKKKKGGKREHKKDKKKKKAEAEGEEEGVVDEDGAEEENGVEVEVEESGEVEEEEPKEKTKKSSKSKDKEKSSTSTTSSIPSTTSSSVSKSSPKSPKSIEDVWFTDTSKEAQQARKEAEFRNSRDVNNANVEAIIQSSKQENKQEQPSTTLKIFLASKPRTNAEINAELKRISLAKGLDIVSKMRTLLEAIIEAPSSTSVIGEVPKDAKSLIIPIHRYAVLFTPFTVDRASSLQFINVIEELISVTHKHLINAMPHILQQLYEDDVLDEDSIVAWYESPPESSWLVKKDQAEITREKAKVFVDWLKTANDADEAGEDEEDEEEEEEEDEA